MNRKAVQDTSQQTTLERVCEKSHTTSMAYRGYWSRWLSHVTGNRPAWFLGGKGDVRPPDCPAVSATSLRMDACMDLCWVDAIALGLWGRRVQHERE